MIQQVIGITCVMLECQEHPLFYIKIPFDTFVSTIFSALYHVKFSLMITPRNFLCDNCSMFVPFKVMFTVRLCFFLICKHDTIGFVHSKR